MKTVLGIVFLGLFCFMVLYVLAAAIAFAFYSFVRALFR